jgi:hypothetical protein
MMALQEGRFVLIYHTECAFVKAAGSRQKHDSWLVHKTVELPTITDIDEQVLGLY